MAAKIKKTVSDEPKVTIFDREFREEDCGHHGSGVGGVLFILAGIILLFNNTGAIPWEFWNHVQRFWPIILILMGTKIILGKSAPARVLMILISLVTFGVIIIYGLSMVGSPLLMYIPNNLIVLSLQICGYSLGSY